MSNVENMENKVLCMKFAEFGYFLLRAEKITTFEQIVVKTSKHNTKIFRQTNSALMSFTYSPTKLYILLILTRSF